MANHELMLRVQAGDAVAFEALVAPHQTRLGRHVAGIVCDRLPELLALSLQQPPAPATLDRAIFTFLPGSPPPPTSPPIRADSVFSAAHDAQSDGAWRIASHPH